MYYVSFWKNGVEKTIADELETREYAYEWAREGLENKSYDEAVIYRDGDNGEIEWYDSIKR